MVTELRLYVEGGGDSRSGKATLQEGFSKFLNPLKEAVRRQRLRWALIACGSRNRTFEAFCIAQRQHVDAFNVLLVDAEGPVEQLPWQHLCARDGWVSPRVGEEHCHLMVQTMEAWLLADAEALAAFYGNGFNAGALPGVLDIETVDKPRLEQALKQATRRTQKGEYHKLRHGPKLLALLAPAKVRARARHCDRLFACLEQLLAPPGED